MADDRIEVRDDFRDGVAPPSSGDERGGDDIPFDFDDDPPDDEIEAPSELVRLADIVAQVVFGARSTLRVARYMGVEDRRYKEMEKLVERIQTRARYTRGVRDGYSALKDSNPMPAARLAMENAAYDVSRLLGNLANACSSLKDGKSQIPDGGEQCNPVEATKKQEAGHDDPEKRDEMRQDARSSFASAVLEARKAKEPIPPHLFPRGAEAGLVSVADADTAMAEYQRLPRLWQESLARAVAGLPVARSPEIAKVCDVLESEFPWMREANRHVRETLEIRRVGMANGFWMPPLLIDGAPGVGKSRWAKRLTELVCVPYSEASCAGLNDSFSILGNNRSYQNAEPGMIYKKVMGSGVANPIIVLDELDKTSTSTNNGRLVDALLTVLEPSTASRVTDNFLQVPIDASRISWVFCSNSLAGIPEPLLSRLTVVRAEEPEREDAERAFPALVKGVAEDFGADPSALPEIGEEMREALLDEFEGHRSLRLLKARIRRAMGEAIAPSEIRRAKDLERVALHEAGHAIMAKLVGRTVLKASVVPDDLARGAAGFVLSTLADRDRMETAETMKGRVALALGGYAAERHFFGAAGISHGSSSDIEAATETCRRIVRLGLSTIGVRVAGCKEIDVEAQKILDEAMVFATASLSRNAHVVKAMADGLRERGSMGRHQAEEYLSLARNPKATGLLARLLG